MRRWACSARAPPSEPREDRRPLPTVRTDKPYEFEGPDGTVVLADGGKVVMGRDRLAGLVAHHGAQPLQVGLFTGQEVLRLLTIRLGAHRSAAEPQAVQASRPGR